MRSRFLRTAKTLATTGITRRTKMAKDSFGHGTEKKIDWIPFKHKGKKYELEFIDALANKVFEDIKNIN